MSATAIAPVAAADSRSRQLAATVVGAGLVGTVALAVAAARHAAPSAVSPLVPRGSWNAVWIAALVVAFALYGAGTVLARGNRVSLRIALGIAVAVQAAPVAAPLLLSKDAYLYWGEARVLTVHHANPYRAAPGDYPTDPAVRWISESWRDEPTPYGPAWTVASAAPAVAAGDSAHAAALVFRVLAVLALLASVALVARRTRSAAAVAFLGWSPLLALHYGGGGHGDALMMLIVLGAVTGGTSARVGALWPVASAFKPFPPVLVPLELARRRLAMGTRWWTGLLASTAAVAAASTALFGTRWVHAALTGTSETSPLGGVHWLMELGLRHRYAVVVAALAFLVVYAFLLRDAWRRGRARFSLAATALCLTSSLLRPWYGLWAVALAAVEEDALGAAVAYALSGYLLFGDAVRL
jgi:hypothetical protein